MNTFFEHNYRKVYYTECIMIEYCFLLTHRTKLYAIVKKSRRMSMTENVPIWYSKCCSICLRTYCSVLIKVLKEYFTKSRVCYCYKFLQKSTALKCQKSTFIMSLFLAALKNYFFIFFENTNKQFGKHRIFHKKSYFHWFTILIMLITKFSVLFLNIYYCVLA